MQKVLIGILILLSGALLYFQHKNVSLNREITLVSDSLNNVKQQLVFRRKVRSNEKVDLFIKQNHLRFFYDSLEHHKIIVNFGQLFFDIRFNLLADSSVLATLAKYSEKNPLTGVGVDTIYYTSTKKFEYLILKDFKKRLSKINFINAIVDVNTMCCFSGGGIVLESVFSRTERIGFSTFCRESVEFAEACEFLMLQLNDDDLKKYIASTK